jgi:hypothetical protein
MGIVMHRPCMLSGTNFSTNFLFKEFLSFLYPKASDNLSFIILPLFHCLIASIHQIGLITSIHPYCKQQFGSFHLFPLWISFISRTWVFTKKDTNSCLSEIIRNKRLFWTIIQSCLTKLKNKLWRAELWSDWTQRIRRSKHSLESDESYSWQDPKSTYIYVYPLTRYVWIQLPRSNDEDIRIYPTHLFTTRYPEGWQSYQVSNLGSKLQLAA